MGNIASVLINDYIEPGKITAATVRARLLAQYPFDSITCDITSGGGDYYEGFDIYNVLRGYGVPVTTRIPEFCASIATVIFLAGDIRLVSSGPDRGLIHNPWSDVSGDYYQITDYANTVLKPVMDELITFYGKNTRLDKATLDTLLRVDTTLSGEQMVAMGFATSLYNPAASTVPTETQARHRILARASITPRTKPTNPIMSAKKTALERAFDSIRAAFNGDAPKALDTPLADGSTLSTDSMGDMPVIGDATAAADGEYTCPDGTVIVVAGGIVTDVVAPAATDSQDIPLAGTEETPVASDEIAQLRAENEDLRTQLAAVQTTQASILTRVNAVLGAVQSQDIVVVAAKAMKPVSAKPTMTEEETKRATMLAEIKAKGARIA